MQMGESGKKGGPSNSMSSSLHKFSLQTDPKSHASTYYSMNNAVRQETHKLTEKQKKALVFRRLNQGLLNSRQRRQSQNS